jgi:tRNA nucleotidyltransferase (CCA-adding enzyme)
MEASEGISLLRLPKRLTKRIEAYLRGQKSSCLEKSSESVPFDCFELYSEAVFDALIINDRTELWEQAERYLKCNESPLLRGEDLARLGIKEGPEMGELLRFVRKAEYEGQISTPEEALQYVQNILKRKIS